MPDDESAHANEPGNRAAALAWDAAAILRSRTQAARRQQDESITALRSAMDDKQIRDELGIDLSAITDPHDDVDADADPGDRESER